MIKAILGNGVDMNFIFRWILGPLVLGWASYHFVLGAQLATGEKRLVCIPENACGLFQLCAKIWFYTRMQLTL